MSASYCDACPLFSVSVPLSKDNQLTRTCKLQQKKLFPTCCATSSTVKLPTLKLIYRDDYLGVFSKPCGLMMHRNVELARHEHLFLVDIASKLVGTRVYPVQRLDRGTSGVIVLSLHGGDIARQIKEALERGTKEYLALVQGTEIEERCWVNEHGLKEMGKKKGGVKRDARTEFELMERFMESGLSLIKARPITGVRHQIRRHLANSRLPILGDVTHGKGKFNRVWREKGLDRLFLHARRVLFQHPFRDQEDEQVMKMEDPLPLDLVQFLRNLPDFNPEHESAMDL